MSDLATSLKPDGSCGFIDYPCLLAKIKPCGLEPTGEQRDSAGGSRCSLRPQ